MTTSPATSTSPDHASGARRSWPARLGAALLLAVLLVAGVWVLGNLAPSSTVAMATTTVFFGAVALGVLVLVRRSRPLLLPLATTYAVVVGAAGVWLGLPLLGDDVVDEDVVRVEPAASAPTQAATSVGATDEATDAAQPAEPAGPVAVAQGAFEARDHPGEGDATLVDTGEGTVVTLTDFATDNGPDLFVYLVPDTAPAGSVDDFVDLGTLKGNVGDQQYDVPAGVDAGAGWRVVVWCRAFNVTFTEATLA